MKSTRLRRKCYKYLDRMLFLLYMLISNMLSENGAIHRCIEIREIEKVKLSTAVKRDGLCLISRGKYASFNEEVRIAGKSGPLVNWGR